MEFVFGIYMAGCAVASVIHYEAALCAPFLVMFSFGFFYVSVMSFVAQRMQARDEAEVRTSAVTTQS